MGDVAFRGDQEAGATFSPCLRYRYLLWRRWGDGEPAVFILLNPSTADHRQTDPTVERCLRRARDWGHPAMIVANLFALRSPDPRYLYEHGEPVGSRNDDAIRGAAEGAAVLVCGWGNRGALLDRHREALQLIRAAGGSPRCFGHTKQGYPRHPLYVPYSAPLEAVRDG